MIRRPNQPRNPALIVPKKTADPAITMREYGGLQAAYDHLNRALFDGKLPDAMITLQCQAHSKGYFAANRFSARSGEFQKSEIALNPDAFKDRTDEQIISTLAHEMTHLLQHISGTAPSRGYHNKEFAAMMKSIGLMPSTTGAVGGKETGQRLTHYIIPNGPYAQAFKVLEASGWKLQLESAVRAGGSKAPPSKVKFSCTCGQNAWGKPDLAIRCDPCDIPMLSAV